MNIKPLIAIALGYFVVSCAPSKIVAPLEQGNWQAGATLGRPEINEGSLPVLGIYAAKGVANNRTIYGGMGLSSSLFGAIQLEGGVVKGLVASKGWMPGYSISYGANAFMSARNGDFRLYPDAGANMYWKKGPHIAHLSANTWVDPTWFLSRYGQGQILAPSLGAGYRFRYKWLEVQAEYKLVNPSRELMVPQADVPGIAGLGGRGFYYGLALNF